eukprot:3786607-Prymnesium_polylepis.1
MALPLAAHQPPETTCAWSGVHRKNVSFVPGCTQSKNRPLCEQQHARISGCPLVLSRMESIEVSERDLASRRLRLMRALTGKRILITGDSSVRQAFSTLVARLRGQDWVVDYNGWNKHVVYHQHATHWYNSSLLDVADAWDLRAPMANLSMPMVASDAETTVLEGARDALPPESSEPLKARLRHWMVRMAASRGPRRPDRSDSVRVDFIWAPCCDEQTTAARAALAQGNFSHLFVFTPAYWHLNGGACSKKFYNISNASSASTMKCWQPWLRYFAGSRVTAVTAPVEVRSRAHINMNSSPR